MKLFRILVILTGLIAMFWDMPYLTNQLLLPLCKASGDFSCCKDSSLIMLEEFYNKGTLFLSCKTFSVDIIIF